MNTIEAAPATYLFCPGHRPDRYDKAMRSGAPGVVLDLEDAVPPAQKAEARLQALSWIGQQPHGLMPRPQVALRINPPETEAGLEDLYALVNAGALPALDVVVQPKVSDAGEVRIVAGHVTRHRAARRLIALIETVRGVEHAREIAQADPSVVALGFGAADLGAELGIGLEWEPLLHVRSQLVLAVAGSAVSLLDVPHLQIEDEPGLREACRRVLALGFHGKFAIHPRQVLTILESFRPTPEQAERARRVVDAYESAGRQACSADGSMVDEPVYRRALRTLGRVA